MKRYSILILIIIAAGLFLGCSQEDKIRDTINAFEDAVNLTDSNLSAAADDLEGIMSPDSSFYVTSTFSQFLTDNFSGNLPVNYSSLDISVDGGDGDVYADATYLGGTIPDEVWFWMRREGSFFSSDWRVYRYYNNEDFDTPVWQKLKDRAVPLH